MMALAPAFGVFRRAKADLAPRAAIAIHTLTQ
jgi:hypothetical protein